ncbi:unnamed protein product [Jaminaea pallidilutea]
MAAVGTASRAARWAQHTRSSCRTLEAQSLVLTQRRFSSGAQLRQTRQSSQTASLASGSQGRTPSKVIFSGIQPTGTPHLGNLLGALFNWHKLQSSSDPATTDLFFSIVGLHAITSPQDPPTLRDSRYDLLAALLAVGLDPARSTIFLQESVKEHAELYWIFSTLVGVGRLRRMTTWKGKMADRTGESMPTEAEESTAEEIGDKDEDPFTDLDSTPSTSRSALSTGLFTYPVLQAADILLYKGTHVPVGEDQLQHLELCREIAQSFNRRFCSSSSESGNGKSKQNAGDLFQPPEVLVTPSPKILSLRDPSRKMSKSHPDLSSRILLDDDATAIRSKIKRAVTDGERHLSMDPVQRPGVANLLRICAALENFRRQKQQQQQQQHRDQGHNSKEREEAAVTPEDIADRLNASQGGGSGALKALTTQLLVDTLVPIGDEYRRLRADRSYLMEVAEQGKERASQRAGQTMAQVRALVGLD